MTDLALSGETILVAGASRGIGRGAAAELDRLGGVVYATGRSIEGADLPDGVTRIVCDHTDDAAVAALFERIAAERPGLDILVNCVWGGYEHMAEEGEFTWPAPFWEQPVWRWEAMMNAGVRAAFTASRQAARLMIPAGRGLIVNLSYWAARKRLGNAIYGISKAATDKLTADAAEELRPHGVAVVSLYPGLVRTESVLASGIDTGGSESPEFSGRVVCALWGAPDLMERSGEVVVGARVARERGFVDIDGSSPPPLTLSEA